MQRPQASEALSEEEIAQAYLFSLYKTEPDFFVEHGLGHVTWGKQREILQSVRDHKKTAVKACHGASKTFTAAEVAVWFLNVFPKSKVITTAPTYPQVEMLLWAEINEIYSHSRIQLESECLMTKIKTEDNTHYAVGFSTDKPARAEGWHSPAMLFIFDEAKGIPAWLYDSARALMTGGFCRWLVISTTDGVEVGEPFYEIFNNDDNDWNKISVSAEDTPYCTGEKFRGLDVDENNLCKFTRTWIDPKDIVIQIATPEYIDECRVDWGEDSPLFQTKVLGMLSDVGADTIIKLSQINKMWANADNSKFDETDVKLVSERKCSEEELSDMKFAWAVCKHVKSNAIVFVKNKKILGVGAGQMSRVDSARIAAMKAEEHNHDLKGAVAASDAFFPFADGLLEIASNGVTAVVQPGGSVRDQEVIDAANSKNIAMIFTGKRNFKH